MKRALVRVGSNERLTSVSFLFTSSSKSTIFLIYDDPMLFHNFFAPLWVATVLCVKAGFPNSNQMGQKRKDEFFRYFRISFEKVDALKALEKWWPTDRRTEKGHPAMTLHRKDWNHMKILIFFRTRYIGNGVCNGAISITLQGFISGCYKVKSIGQWGKILVMAMGFVDHLGQCL
jgi:hypothetical protein